jgi:two-component system, OmpR family, KDP operon response regulator KdpE
MKSPHAPAVQVLVIEDEAPIRQLLRTTLQAEGYVVHEAVNARDGEALAQDLPIDVFLLDLGLPDADGIALLRRVREWSRRPIIVISARTQEAQKVQALDAGADDFLSKPFGVAELHARLRVALRNARQIAKGEPQVLQLGPVSVDMAAMTVRREGQALRLTAMQWRLLEVLARHHGRVVSSGQLLREVWGPGNIEQGHYLRIYVRQLRQRLEVEPSKPRYLLTETGIGYRLQTDADTDSPALAQPLA